MRVFGNKFGFTLIELMVAISIVAILSTVAVASYSGLQKNTRAAKRGEDLKAISLALEAYKAANGSYPCSNTTGSCGNNDIRSQCSLGQSASYITTISNDLVPNLVPTYMPNIPNDPLYKTGTVAYCYAYRSNGSDYKVWDQYISENNYLSRPDLIDPRRDGGTSNSAASTTSCDNADGTDGVDNALITAWAIYSLGGRCW